MFQSFTGNARRPRQVNLSGRNTNPFASSPAARQAPHGYGPQNTLAIAQQERILRQQERERLGAARTLQRTWRGYKIRKVIRSLWRAEWDAVEQRRVGGELSFNNYDQAQRRGIRSPPRYSTPTECLSQLRLLLHFLEIRKEEDAARLVYFSNAFRKTLEEVPMLFTDGEWMTLLVRLAKTTLRVLHTLAASSRTSTFSVDPLLQLLRFLIGLIPKQMARIAKEYYSVMATLTINIQLFSISLDLSVANVVASVLALLQPITSETLGAYEWFAREYLTVPDLAGYIGSLEEVASNINYKLLTSALDAHISHIPDSKLVAEDVNSRLWLLSYFIFFHRYALGGAASQEAPEPGFVKVVSDLLNSLAMYLSRRLEPDDFAETERNPTSPLPSFVREQIVSLVNQNSITGLLSRVRLGRISEGVSTQDETDSSSEAKIVASYALTLLRVFSRRGDDIRMWLYLGSATSAEPSPTTSKLRVPAIKYFWQASRNTGIFATISRDSNEVLPLLKPVSADGKIPLTAAHEREQEWTIILLFLELYTFVLKVMDDDEFFSGESLPTVPDTRVSWTKESALPLRDVRDMTIFLKNLAFTLYWNAADLDETSTAQEISSIRSYFSTSALPPESMTSFRDLEQRNKEKGLSGVTGIPLDYFKGLVTGLLRMIHERESVSPF
jgi:ubiquitin-protein ligase E3 C